MSLLDSNAQLREGAAAPQLGRRVPLPFGLVHRRVFSFSAISLFLCGAACAQERCSAEAKLLVKPEQTENAVAALHGRKRSHGKVYLFDTEQLDLLLQGVIVRIRIGAKNDLTVKLRFNERGNNKGPQHENEALKCETDLSGNEQLPSYSLGRNWKDASVPQAGEEVYSALSPGQQNLLGSAGISVDWHCVKRRGEIHATAWKAYPDGPLKAITIELWEWQGGKILELSTRTSQGRGVVALRQLRELAEKNGLTIEENQAAKTSLVLRSSTKDQAVPGQISALYPHLRRAVEESGGNAEKASEANAKDSGRSVSHFIAGYP
jgi:hypothetical protein